MKTYNEFKADILTNKFVYSYITLSFTQYDRFVIFPDGCDYIVFSSKGYCQVYTKKLTFQSIELNEESLFIIRLKPFTLSVFELNELIFKQKLMELSKNVFTTQSILKQMKMTFETLFNSSFAIDEKIYKIMVAINEINDKKGEISVQDLAESLSISIRTLQRRFKEYVGLTPKEYISIMKMQADIRKVKKLEYIKTYNPPQYYTDYSHFYKKFKKFTNISPKLFYKSNLNHFSSLYDIF